MMMNSKRILTNTNTDTICLDASKGWFGKAMYRYNLWTGLYMLNQRERIFFHVFGWMFLVSLFLYMSVFVRGFMDGFFSSDAEVAEAPAGEASL
mmetsp:Transcript_25151/g.58482  ORF Transcript_25151/g.58482 Transcript_25151/m.58482 type:complete len:94 (-) Transcript_25151:492-773(-)